MAAKALDPMYRDLLSGLIAGFAHDLRMTQDALSCHSPLRREPGAPVGDLPQPAERTTFR